MKQSMEDIIVKVLESENLSGFVEFLLWSVNQWLIKNHPPSEQDTL
ncbi:hypothetical protein J2129_001178 [Methanofollis sp. W23]|nr:hypothetical protein [Methanofollis sp. W23]